MQIANSARTASACRRSPSVTAASSNSGGASSANALGTRSVVPRDAIAASAQGLLAGEVLRLEQAAPHARLRLLLLDEPFGSVDPPAHLRLMQSLLAWLRDSSRRAAVLVSHSPLVDLGLAEASGVPTTEWTIDGGRA